MKQGQLPLMFALVFAMALGFSFLHQKAEGSSSSRAFDKEREYYTDFWEEGTYHCSRCGEPLFESSAKFKSGTIWPSFRAAVTDAVSEKPDDSLGMTRQEVVCSRCGRHLGHVFEDGILVGDTHPEAGLRYCILSSALKFKEKEAPAKR